MIRKTEDNDKNSKSHVKLSLYWSTAFIFTRVLSDTRGKNNKNDTSVNEGSVGPTQLDVKYEGQ